MSKTKKSFEEAMSNLEDIVQQLENGNLSLEDSLECFKNGIELSKYCSNKLDEAERKITLLIEKDDGSIAETDFETGSV